MEWREITFMARGGERGGKLLPGTEGRWTPLGMHTHRYVCRHRRTDMLKT